MPGPAGDGGQSGDKGGQQTGDSIQIQVGGETKTFTPQEIATVLEKAGNLERTVEQLSGFQKVITQYGIGPDEYLRNSEAAFAIANSLIEQGIIDQQGNIIKKGPGDQPKGESFKFTPGGDAGGGGNKQLEVIANTLTKLTQQVTSLEEGQSNIYRRNIKRDVQATYPNLEDEDISKLLATAQRDRSKGFWAHAEELSKQKEVTTKQMEKTHVKSTIEALVKAGIIPEGKVDLSKLDEFDLNKLKEQDPSGGAPVWEGKKFIFGSRRRKLGSHGTDVAKFSSPAEAMHELFQKKGG